MGRLDGKVAVITGAAGGIGREAAILFSARARECAWPTWASRRREGGGRMQRSILLQSRRQRSQSVQAMYAETDKRYGRIDVLYNNAASCRRTTTRSYHGAGRVGPRAGR